MCMATQAAPVSAATAQSEADTSLMIDAPAATARLGPHRSWRVSTDMAPSPASAWITGSTRRSLLDLVDGRRTGPRRLTARRR